MLKEALKKNQRVWSVLQAELTSADNLLPQQIKKDILRLSIFIDQRTFEVMLNPEPQKLNILIDINLNIAAGLGKIPKNEEMGQVLRLPASDIRPQTNVHV
jgi:flagellar biosynthesis activator protein FlaF